MILFKHKDYKELSNIFFVSKNGVVKNKFTGNVLKHHNDRFVRLSRNGFELSIQIHRLMLLTYKPESYSRSKIAISIDGNPLNHNLSNLKWGTRAEQSNIAMKNESKFKSIQKMGRKYGKLNWKTNLTTDGSNMKHKQHTIDEIISLTNKGMTPTQISKKLSISRSSIYKYI